MDYRQLVERRMPSSNSDPNIRLIEQPDYKRRWNTEPWESSSRRALANGCSTGWKAISTSTDG